MKPGGVKRGIENRAPIAKAARNTRDASTARGGHDAHVGARSSTELERAVESEDEPAIESSDLESGHQARDLAAVVVERIAAGKPVRRTLAGGGRLHVDRALPFLCVYRPRGEEIDAVVRDFARTQAAYLITPIGRDITPFVEAVVDELAKKCGACLLLEIWAGEDPRGPFRIHAHENAHLATTIDAFADALREMNLSTVFGLGIDASETVEVIVGEPSPTGTAPLVAASQAAQAGVLAIGLEVPPRYRPASAASTSAESSRFYPFVARSMARELAHALQRCFYEFARVQTPTQPAHFHAMGRRNIVRAVREADHALAEISSTFDFLLAVTPVNTDAAWQAFCETDKRIAPVLRYRMLEVDPAIGKRQLYDLPLDRLEDPVLAQLLHDKRRELDRQLGLLEDRDTPLFVHGSVQLYGAVNDELLAEARAILGRSVPAKRDEPRLGCAVVVERAREEIDRYRRVMPGLASRVVVRDDIAALMVSHGDVLVPAKLEVTELRLQALLQHEVGTHVVTYANGFSQPLRVLAAGLGGYEALQEGLALIAEYVVGGLDVERLRLIAARVVAVRRMVEGVEFVEVVRELEGYGLSGRGAFATAVRVFRGGGLTKDAIYLRGLLDVLAYLRAGRDIESLLVGKIALDQVPLIEELLRRGVLQAPTLRPHWLDGEGAAARLAKLREGLTPLELLEAA